MKPVHAEANALRPFQSTTCIIIGKYRLTRFSGADIWIDIVGDGEGGAFKEIELERALDAFWSEHF